MTAFAFAGERFLKVTLGDPFPEEDGDVLLHWLETWPGLPHLKQGRSFFGTSVFGQSEMWCPGSRQLRQRDPRELDVV